MNRGGRASVVRFVSRFTAIKDEQALSKLVNTSLFTYTLIGVVTGDAVACSATASFDNPNVGFFKTVTASNLTLIGDPDVEIGPIDHREGVAELGTAGDIAEVVGPFGEGGRQPVGVRRPGDARRETRPKDP